MVDDDLRPVLFWEEDFMDLPKCLPILRSCSTLRSCQVTDGSGRLGNNLAFILRNWAVKLNRLGSGNFSRLLRYQWMMFLQFAQHIIGI